MSTLNFKSDNEAPAHPKVLEALTHANQGFASAYATDQLSDALNDAFSQYFDTPLQVLPLATGTAANSIILGELCPPWGSIWCHSQAHIHNDEGTAPEFYTHGAKLAPIPGGNGKLNPERLNDAIAKAGAHGVHNAKPSVVSITQATECGTSYRPNEIQALSEVAKCHRLPLHMDGARFSNALMHLQCHPSEITWRAGVDVLAYGGSKNGGLCAEAIIVFGHPEWLEGLERRRKRGGHLLSKMRFVSAQLLALLEDDLAHDIARQANALAQRLAQGIEASPCASLKWPVEANEVFVKAQPNVLAWLKEQGCQFHIWPGFDDVGRLVCSHETEKNDIDRFIQLLNQAPQ